ncbi:DUF2075 domain-containing protein [Prolixibacteraceae bacterium]|nr:DUF2075 domain-containing protein [Prolixibacteraceae bacterium]
MSNLTITNYKFDESLSDELRLNHYAKNMWPLVYILNDGASNKAYIGETTDVFKRMNTHLKNETKNKLNYVTIITCDKFNKSATLDIESNLIRYMSGDNKYVLLNGNMGIANHNYYQKQEVYWSIFTDIWNKLQSKNIVEHSLNHITNSDLFKYSPYKSLSEEQLTGLFSILEGIHDVNTSKVIVNGGAGTGKTILAIFLFKLLHSDLDDFNFRDLGDDISGFIKLIKDIRSNKKELRMALVVPMSSFRETLQNVFKNIQGLSKNMVIGPSGITKDLSNKYDIVIVDEAHRLRRRRNLTNYKSFDDSCKKLGLDPAKSNELEWILSRSKTTILFHDYQQTIKPSDIDSECFRELELDPNNKKVELKSQLRVKGGTEYVRFINNLLLNSTNFTVSNIDFHDYELKLFDSLDDMIDVVEKRDQEYGLSRLIAGFAWRWISKNDKSKYDIEIGDTRLRWNSTNKDWINKKGCNREVGCIHTTQGYDLNYTGIVFGPEISYDADNNEICVLKDNYHDKNGKNSIKTEAELKDYIVNIYKTILLRGIRGTYIYVCDQKLREYFKRFIPMSVNQSHREFDIRDIIIDDNVESNENRIPLYNLRAAAGPFSEVQQIDELDWVMPPSNISNCNSVFVCQVVGESMNKIIPNGSYCLFKKCEAGSRNGKIVLAESFDVQFDDGAYTVKEYESIKWQGDTSWEHEKIILKPRSTDTSFEDIILTGEDLTSFHVVGEFVQVLESSQFDYKDK